MYSLQDANIHNLAVKGMFDDCQDLVKKVNADAAFKARHRIGAVNSINWARVAAQVVYYFKGYFAATRSDGEQVSFAVPSGNFGNIYAGHVARAHGAAGAQADPGQQRERRARSVLQDRNVQDPQVGEADQQPLDGHLQGVELRALRARARRAPTRVRQLWRELDAAGEFRLRACRFDIVSGRSTHADRIATIRRLYSEFGVMVDPHTADGVKVGLEHAGPGEPLICLETAQPVKFAETLREALGREPARPAAFEGLEQRPQRVEVMDADVEALKRYIAAHAQ